MDDVSYPFPEALAESLNHTNASHFGAKVCNTVPTGWTDSRNVGCAYYQQARWCNADGSPGVGWDKGFGELKDYARDGVTAMEACCECGGGKTDIVAGIV